MNITWLCIEIIKEEKRDENGTISTSYELDPNSISNEFLAKVTNMCEEYIPGVILLKDILLKKLEERIAEAK